MAWLRNKILQAFELAEAEETRRHRELLTFVMVGAGPTGVEMAAALGVFIRTTLKKDFRRIDPASARIVLIDMAPRVLTPFSEHLSEAAKERLESLGVEVRLGHSVEQIDDGGVVSRRANPEQDRHLDSRCRSLAGGKVVANRDGSRRSSTHSK